LTPGLTLFKKAFLSVSVNADGIRSSSDEKDNDYPVEEQINQDSLRQDLQAIEEQLGTAQDALALKTLIDVLESPAQSFSLMGRKVGITGRLSCVVPSYAFAAKLFNRDSVGLGDSEVTETMVWKMFERGQIIPEKHFNREAELTSSRRNFFWATLTQSLDKVLSGSKLSATDVRNLLGLSYLSEGVGLYRIDLPDQLPAGIRICVPTTLDSSPTCVFLPVDNQSNFGQTFHLNMLDNGVEEVVISPVPFTTDCKVTPIGFVSAPLPDDNTVWCELEKRVVDRRSRKTSTKTTKKKVPRRQPRTATP
jgi:hypothetical protein